MPIILGILLMLGVGGGVVVKSNDARPGDPFFQIDQTIEKIQLAFSSEENKKKLNTEFAKERLDEVEELITEKKEAKEDGQLKDFDEDISAGLSLSIDVLGKIDIGEKYKELSDQLNGLLRELPKGSELEIKLSESGADFIKVRSEDDNSKKMEIEVKETTDGKFLIKQRIEEEKMEVEVENEVGKIKIKTEDGGKAKVETEIKKEESDVEDSEVEVEIEEENKHLKDYNSKNDDKNKSEDDNEDEGSGDSQDDD